MKVLFATDGSPSATHALQEGLRLLPLGQAEVSVVAVTDPSQRFGGNEDAADDLARAIETLRAAGCEPKPIEARGEPAATIIEVARDLGADLVVVGSHGRGGLGRLVLGSVSDAVVRGWAGATLVVKAAT